MYTTNLPHLLISPRHRGIRGACSAAMNGGHDGAVTPVVRKTSLLIVVGHAALLGACGMWNTEKLDATTAHVIDGHLPSGMSVAAFQGEFPQAVLIDGDDRNGSWFVHVQRVCFWCRTAEGFQRSADVYTRIVRFEDGRLAGIDAVGTSP